MNEILSPCEHRALFMVIDLYQQRDAICAYTQGWSKAAIVEWLSLYGKVLAFREVFMGMEAAPAYMFDDNRYYFFSHIANHRVFNRTFRFNDNDEFEVLRF